MKAHVRGCTFLLICFVVAFSQQQHKQSSLSEIEEDCIQEAEVLPDDADKVLNQPEFPVNTPLKCFVKCVAMKFNIMDPSGNIIEDGLKTVAKDYYGITDGFAIDRCKGLQKPGGDICENAYVILQCLIKSAPKG